jgi:hypothetical protein
MVLALRPEGILPERSTLTLKHETIATIVETEGYSPNKEPEDSSLTKAG